MAGKRKAITTVRRMRYAPTHPLAPRAGYVSEARVVLYEKVGPGSHPCHWCGAIVAWAVGKRGNVPGVVTAEHLDGNELNDAPENLAVACARCNGTRQRRIPEGTLFIVRKNGSRLRAEERVCAVCEEPFLCAIGVGEGKGLTCSKSCARKLPRA